MKRTPQKNLRSRIRNARRSQRRARRSRKRRDENRHKRFQRRKSGKTSRFADFDLNKTRKLVDSIFTDLHAKRVQSLANYATGVMHASSATIHTVGAAYAEVAHIKPKSGIKQVDRYLSNKGIDVEALTPCWAQFVTGSRPELLVALDWTEFQSDDQTTLCAYVVTTHGRATPLCWQSYRKSSLTDGKRTEAEHAFVDRLARAIPSNVGLTLLADRGFGSKDLYETLRLLGWDFVIRFRTSILVEHGDVRQPVQDWLAPSGRAKKLRGATVTADAYEVGAVVVVRRKAMKQAWYLVTSMASKTASAIIKLYGRRFTIEETFRDQKDLHFGMGLSATHIRSPARRDRLLMLLAIAQALLTLLGAASERTGMDAYLKANTVKRRTHSLFRQGSYWYRCLPTMRDEWFEPLMAAFEEILSEHRYMHEILGVI